MIAPGRLSWATDVLRAAGARNPIGGEDVKSRPLEDAEVRELWPQFVIMGGMAAAALAFAIRRFRASLG